MVLREIANRLGVVYDATKKYRIYAEDLQGLDARITDLEIGGVGVVDVSDIILSGGYSDTEIIFAGGEILTI